MLILGLNMFHADASAAIVRDGEVLFAIAEERLNRIKHFGGFPALAIQACLDAAGASMEDVDHVAVGQDSAANLLNKVRYAVANPARVSEDSARCWPARCRSMRSPCDFRSIISSITSPTLPAPTTAPPGRKRPDSAMTVPGILSRP
jgi:predicted NodU family carbamoyl transferase